MRLSLPILFSYLGSLSLVSGANHWCGKPYAAVRHSPVAPDPTVNPNPAVITTVKSGFAAQFRFEPYLSTDAVGSLVVNAPQNGTYQVAVSLNGTPLLAATTVPASDSAQEIKGVDLTKLAPQLPAYNVTITFTSGSATTQTITTLVHRLPAGPKTVRIDRLYGGIIPSNSQTAIFPFGPYVDFGWITGSPGMQANLQTLKSLGFNIINPDPTFTDPTAMDQLLQICETLGIYVQVSFRYNYKNTTAVVQQVQRWMNYSAVLTWYTADEPDGTQWTTVTPTVSVYKAVKGVDPYKPVAMLLNCQNTAGYYTTSTDIFGTDMYPIGINTTGCAPTAGDCGCDLCSGNIATDFTSRRAKYWNDIAAQGLQATPVWMGLQGFSDPTTWWSRAPTPQEFIAMFYLTITEGYRGITFWKYPYVPDNTLQATHTALAAQLLSISPYLTTLQQIPASHITVPGNSTAPTLFAAAWAAPDMSSILFIIVNAANAPSSFSATISDAAKVTVTGKDLTGAAVSMTGGVVAGQLPALGVQVVTFGGSVTATPVASNGTPSGTSSLAVVNPSTGIVPTTHSAAGRAWKVADAVAAVVVGMIGLFVVV